MIDGAAEKVSSTVSDGVDKTVATAEQTARHPYTQKLGRFGYFTKGILYFLIGALAAMAATGLGGELADRRGVLEVLDNAPFGKFLLIAVMIGAVGYGLWSILRGAADVDGKGTNAKGWIIRIAFVGIGISYLIFAWAAWKAFSSTRHAADDSTPQTISRTVLEQPFGIWLLLIAGLVIIGVGVFQIYKAITAKFMERVNLGNMDESRKTAVVSFGRFGYASRGIIFGIVGFFIARAAWSYNPNEAKGIDGALAVVGSQSYGRYLLLAIALGLVSFGIFSMIESRYRSFGKITADQREVGAA